MHKTVIKELGPFVTEQTYHVDQEQTMQFTDRDQGPFYFSPEERLAKKHPVPTGREVRRSKTKPELMCELKRSGFEIKGRYTMDEIRKQAQRFNIPLQVTEEVIKPGCVGQNKGLLQVLWERGWIDQRNIRKYKLEATVYSNIAHDLIIPYFSLSCTETVFENVLV